MGIGLTALVGAAALLLLVYGRTPPASQLPDPNGYDDLRKAGQTVMRKVGDPAEPDHDGLRALVATNAEALRLLRVGLARRCVVPTDDQIANFASNSRDLINLKSLAMVLAAEGRLAEIENRPADAARSYVDAIRLGTAMSRGGLMINRLVGIACEAIGSIPLAKLLPKLNCDQIRPLVAELETLNRDTVEWPEVLRNENRWVRAQLGSYPNPVKLVSDWWQARDARKAAQQKHDLAAAHIRLLATELALRSYRCEQGNAPEKLEQLIPKYLQRIPSDPFSNHAVVYHSNGTNWLLYSLGPDRVDNAGAPLGRIVSGDELTGFGTTRAGKGQNQGDLLYNGPW